MTTDDLSLLTDAERILREQFDQAAANRRRLPSTAITPGDRRLRTRAGRPPADRRVSRGIALGG